MKHAVIGAGYAGLEGLAELQGTWNDKETTLAVLRPVSTFILAAVVLDADALMTARTIERSDILMISGEAVRRAMKEDAGFAVAVAEADRREPRRDLVPLRQEITVFGGKRLGR